MHSIYITDAPTFKRLRADAIYYLNAQSNQNPTSESCFF